MRGNDICHIQKCNRSVIFLYNMVHYNDKKKIRTMDMVLVVHGKRVT